MLIWAIYDISDNRKRTKLAKLLKNAGLYRVQKSVFLGDIEKNRMDELAMQCEPCISSHNDALYLFPMCANDFKLTLSLGKALNRELVSDELLAVIL